MGNDIVALAATDSERTCRYRFYSRIITPLEKQQFYHFKADAGISFSSFVWMLWSIKESVYKYCSRADPQLLYAPLKIGVDNLESGDGFIRGRARYGDALLYSRSWISSQFIATIVSDAPGFEGARYGVHRIGTADHASQSAKVREFALESLASHYPGAALRIESAPGLPPVVRHGEQLLDLPISLAHHEHYLAYAYRLPPNSCESKKSAAN